MKMERNSAGPVQGAVCGIWAATCGTNEAELEKWVTGIGPRVRDFAQIDWVEK